MIRIRKRTIAMIIVIYVWAVCPLDICVGVLSPQHSAEVADICRGGKLPTHMSATSASF